MGNVLERAKQEQVIALGRLGWSLRRIEVATGASGKKPVITSLAGFELSAGVE
jgi:hypothetical protein